MVGAVVCTCNLVFFGPPKMLHKTSFSNMTPVPVLITLVIHMFVFVAFSVHVFAQWYH